MSGLRLFSTLRSGNCYRVRLLLALLDLPYETVEATGGRGQLTAPGLLTVNPLGEVPVLVDGDLVLRDSHAIMVYLAARHGPAYLPSAPADLAAMMQWLALSANEIQNGLRMARAIKVGGMPGDRDGAMKLAHRALGLIDRRLVGRDWLETARPTIADLAVYAYVCSAHESGIEMKDYPAIGPWLRRIAALPGYVPLSDVTV